MEKWVVGVFLGICSASDIKRKEIHLLIIGIFGISGILFQVCTGNIATWKWGLGALMGISMLGISFVTREAIGYGDGLVIGVLGLWLGIVPAFEILFLGLCASALVSAVLIIIKKVARGYRIAFVPFILLAWILWIGMNIKGG